MFIMISKIHATETLKGEFGVATYSTPASVTIGLATVIPTEATGAINSELSSSYGYARVTVDCDSAKWEADAVTGYVKNKTAIEFDAFTSTPSPAINVSHWFMSPVAAGAPGDKANYYDVLKDANGGTTTYEVKAGGKLTIPAGQLQIGRVNPS